MKWQQETLLYDRAHPRLVHMARLLRKLPGNRILDVGCSTGMLGRVLGPGYEYYGCDIADHADRQLLPGRFLQLDFNQSCDLTHFRGRGIELAHIGGVLEYLEKPAWLLESVRELLGDRGHLVLSIINFECGRYAPADGQHRGWIYRPSLAELRALLAGCGWQTLETVPFLGIDGFRDLVFAGARLTLGSQHAWVQGQTRQFLLTARAV
jgi:2-polyprenyl-3-methyl-5-hydroxy-6-metoxy-1,4-benzoquinol methylase